MRKSYRSAPRGDTGTKIRRCSSIGKQLLTCRGAVAEQLTCQDASADWQGRGGEPSRRCCRQGAPWRRAIGKMWLAEGAAVAEILLAGAPRSAERKEGRCVGDPARGGPSVGDGGPVPNR